MGPARAFAAAAFLWFSLGVSPAHFWFDSGEISGAAVELGVMHPTGVPGLLPFFHLAQMIPLGTLGFRMGLVSAGFAAALIGLVARLLLTMRVPAGLVLVSATWLAVGYTLVRNARVVEIYSFGAFLVVLVLSLVLNSRRSVEKGQPALASMLLATGAAVVSAWGFGDARLCLAPLFFVLWVRALRNWPAWACWAQPVVALASLPCLAVALSSARMPVADWGDPDGVLRLWQHLNASSIRAAFGDQMFPATYGLWQRNLDQLLSRSLEDLGPACLLLPCVLLWNLLKRQPLELGARRLLAWVCVCQIFYIVAINPMGGRDRQTGVLLCAIVVIWLALELSAALPETGWPRGLRMQLLAGACVILSSLGVLPAHSLSAHDQEATTSWQPHLWTRTAYARLPPSGRLLTQSDDLAAGGLALTVLEGGRPDVLGWPAQHLYRRLPDRWRTAGGRDAERFQAALLQATEAARIMAWIEVESSLVYLEYPGVAMFKSVAHGVVSGNSLLSERSVSMEARFDDLRRLETMAQARPDRRRVAQAYAARARARLRRQPPERALEQAFASYRHVLADVAPDHVPSLVSLGLLEAKVGAFDRAELLWRRALELEPWRPRPLIELSKLLIQRGAPSQVGEAHQLATRACSVSPGLCKTDPR